MPDTQAQRDILIVEDSDDDFEATERALRRVANLPNMIRRCHDGLEAWEYLTGKPISNSPLPPTRPGLVLLDLNMPGLDGRKLLQRMREHPELRSIPVVIMTTSGESEDVEACYRSGANSYVHKSASWSEFSQEIRHLYEYWFQVALLPK